MPIDVAAARDRAIIGCRRLQRARALSAPAIAAAAAPGQFVMVKAGRGHDPLLRRPFSVFEVLRDARRRADRHLAAEQTDRRLDRPALRRASPASASTASVRSAGRSRSSIRRPRRGWSPAASASRRSRRSAKRCARRGVRTTLFYGARSGAELFYLDLFRDLGVELVLTTEDGSVGERGRIVAPLDRRLAALDRGRAADALRLRPRRHAGRQRQDRHRDTAGRARCRSNASWAAAWAAATAASCRCAPTTAASITCGRASPDRCWRRIRSCGTSN